MSSGICAVYKYFLFKQNELKNEIVLCSENVMHQVDLIQSICHNKGQNEKYTGLF